METAVIKEVPQMILFGATGRNSGKTTLAVKTIELLKEKYPVTAIKVVTVREHAACPRGGKGCGICKSLKTCFDITEETGDGSKDTMLFRRAGAEKVYLIRSQQDSVGAAIHDALKLIPDGNIIVCESNSVRRFIKPGRFIMVHNEEIAIKPSAEAVMAEADKIVEKAVVENAAVEAILAGFPQPRT